MKNVTNYKNCAPHPAEQKPIEIINLTNIDVEKLPENIQFCLEKSLFQKIKRKLRKSNKN